jgi:hypothetical protein
MLRIRGLATMDRTQSGDTAYEDDSNISPPAPPRFSAAAARRARQVVSLRPDWVGSLRRQWAALGTGTHRTRLVAGVVLVALAGGVVGGLLAAADNDQKQAIDAPSLAAGAGAKSQPDNPIPTSQPANREPISQPAPPESQIEFEGPAIERAVVELKRRRSPSRKRKAYRVAVIYPKQR